MSPPQKPPRKACDACHNIKVRCVAANPGVTGSACQRCIRLEIQCKHSSRTPRKQRLRTDTRVATLEKEIDRLRSSMAQGPILSPLPLRGPEDVRDSNETPMPISAALSEELLTSNDEESLTSNEADELLRTYARDYASAYPIVPVSEAESYSRLSARRPLLAKAIFAVVSGGQRPSVAYKLQNQVMGLLSSSVSSPDVSTLDLVEAILVLVAFFTPPYDFAMRSNSFYQLTHLAFASAYDLGVEDSSRPDLLERQRVYVGCFILSQGLAMNTRRPSMLRSSDALSCCLRQLKMASDRHPMDSLIHRTAELFQIVEGIGENLRRPGSAVDVDDDAVFRQVQHFRMRLLDWHANAALDILCEEIALLFHFTMTYLHEVVLYTEHQASDFVAPFFFEQVGLTAARGNHLSPHGAVCLAQAVSSAQSYLALFISLSPSSIPYLQTGQFMRLLYMAFVMTKLAMSPLDPRSSIGRHVGPQQVKAGFYRGKVLDSLHSSAAHGHSTRVQVFTDRLENLSLYWTALARHLKDSPQRDYAPTNPPESSTTVDGLSTNQYGLPRLPLAPEQSAGQVQPSDPTTGGTTVRQEDFWDPTYFVFLDPTDIDGGESDDIMTEHDVDWSMLMPQ